MTTVNPSPSTDWLALVIGNSRLHWGYFQQDKLQTTWDTQHLSNPLMSPTLPANLLPSNIPNHLPLYVASVVPSQTQLWKTYTKSHFITLDEIPLNNLYPTLGIDRALAVLGAGETYHFPCLVIDAGTALTLTGVDSDRTLVGGAILPGLTVQFQSLSRKTAALPDVNLPNNLPMRWSQTTDKAISSGILYTILAGIQSFVDDWLTDYPNSQILITGGDAIQLSSYFQQYDFKTFQSLVVDQNLIFWGMRSLILSKTVT